MSGPARKEIFERFEKEAYDCLTSFEIDLLKKESHILRNVATSYYDSNLHIKMALLDQKTLESKRELMKMSVCRAAFEMFPDIPPHEGMFKLAKEVGYNIPDKWKHLYNY
jgi:hypothetical protein